MKSRILLFLLAGLYPVCLFAIDSWHIFSAPQLMLLFPLVSLGSLGVLCLFDLAVSSSATRWWPGEQAQLEVARLQLAFQAAAALVVCGVLARNTISAMAVPVELIWLAAAILIAAFARNAYRRGLEALNALLLVLVMLASGQWAYSYLTVTTQLGGDVWLNAARPLSESVKFLKTPNVYFFIAESYPNKAALQTIYQIDNQVFYQQVEARGFALYHDAFSNYHSTLLSLASVFAMAHHHGSIGVGTLDSYSGREIISARIFNAVVETFRRNDYFVQYIHESYYQLSKGAALDYHWPSASRPGALESFLGIAGESPLLQSQREFGPTIGRRLELIRASDQPHFSYIYLASPGHSPLVKGKSQRAVRRIAKFRRGFPQAIRATNPVILHIVDQIIAADPTALIILAGDHGAWGHRLRTLDDGRPAGDRLLALDRLGVLMAVRFPEPYDGAYDEATFSSVNLFRYIFAYLSGNDDVLATRVADDGFITNRYGKGRHFKAIEAGQILDPFHEISNSP